MDVLTDALLVLHFIGLAAILGPALAQLRSTGRHITMTMVWGARAQLLTGIALAGLVAGDDDGPSPAKLAVKLLVALAVVGICEATHKKGAVAWAFLTVTALTVINICVAVLWH